MERRLSDLFRGGRLSLAEVDVLRAAVDIFVGLDGSDSLPYPPPNGGGEDKSWTPYFGGEGEAEFRRIRRLEEMGVAVDDYASERWRRAASRLAPVSDPATYVLGIAGRRYSSSDSSSSDSSPPRVGDIGVAGTLPSAADAFPNLGDPPPPHVVAASSSYDSREGETDRGGRGGGGGGGVGVPSPPSYSANRRAVDPETVDRTLALLRELEKPVTSLRGVGPKTADALGRLGLVTVRSLLWHFPASFVDRTRICRDVRTAEDGSVCTLFLTVRDVYRGGRVLRVSCRDEAGNGVTLLYFHSPSGRGRQIAAAAERSTGGVGSVRAVSGRLKRSTTSGEWEMTNPDFVRPPDELSEIARVEPVYGLTAGLTKTRVAAAVDEALQLGRDLLTGLPESLPPEVLRDLNWPTLSDALLLSHRPADATDAGPGSPARMRLAFEELCMQQARLALTRWRYRNPSSGGSDLLPRSAIKDTLYPSWRDSPLVSSAIKAMPFDLTVAQEDCLGEAWDDVFDVADGGRDEDMRCSMARLLQGDVGSGKTVVAYLIGLGCLESPDLGNVVAILAPTTLLAQQHYRTIKGYLESLEKIDDLTSRRAKERVGIKLLTGSLVGKDREALLRSMERSSEEGEALFLVGTHALLTPEVASRLGNLRRVDPSGDRSSPPPPPLLGLALAVIDEEQRFGVRQRDALSGIASHALYMSATPIPRTLALGGGGSAPSSSSSKIPGPLTGSLDVSVLHSKPESARQVRTSIVNINQVEEIIHGIRLQISNGHKVFWILPVIGEESGDDSVDPSEEGGDSSKVTRSSGASSVVGRHESLSNFLGEDRVGMVHGRMSAVDRERQLKEFADPTSQLDIIVGTTVLEVGIDIPSVTILIIERAEQFGLSQLHQLRGRVGRAGSSAGRDRECHCVMLTDVFDGKSDKVDAMRRLDILRRTDDGAKVALFDLSLRGPGDVLGLKQSGIKSGFTIDLSSHFGMTTAAAKFGRCFLDTDHLPYDASGFQAQIEFGGAHEGRLLEQSHGCLQEAPFYSNANANIQSGLTLRTCLSLFAKWEDTENESGTGIAFLTLQRIYCNNKTTEKDRNLEEKFIYFAKSLSGSLTLPLDSAVTQQKIHVPVRKSFIEDRILPQEEQRCSSLIASSAPVSDLQPFLT